MHIKSFTFFKELICISTFLTSLFASAQSKPGGTSLDVELWLKADQLSLNNGSNVTTWNDQSGNNRNFNQYTANSSPVPLFQTNGMNYNPALDFPTISGNRRKLVGPSSFINSTKEYYIFYVSQSLNTSGYGTVLQFQPSTYNPSVGWNAQNPWFNDGGNKTTTYTNSYAVNTVFFPNAANSATVKNTIYINSTPTVYSGSILSSGSGLMNIGSGSFTTGNPFIGNLSEIIVLSSTKPTLTPGTPLLSEINKVNSYLSIKYGISINPTSQPLYTNSAGEEIWNNSNNPAYTNYIFGVGRDDASGLYQKQSTNYENNDIELSIGNFSNTNKDNNGVISSDKSYLLVGSNNLKSSSRYNYSANTTFNNGEVLQKEVFKRNNRVYKAQITSSTTNLIDKINIKLNNALALTSSYVLVSNTTDFNPTTTSIYPINNGIANDVTISNGQYISFINNEGAPGGVDSSVELWLKSDYLSLNENSNVTNWLDQSTYERNFIQNGTNSVPTLDYNGMNFNQTLKFGNTSNTKLVGPNNFMSTDKEYYIYYVSKSTATSEQTILSFNHGYNPMVGWRNSKPFIYAGGRYEASNGSGKFYSINTAYFPNTANSATVKNHLFVNGVDNSFNGGVLAINNNTSMILGTYNLETSSPFYGNLDELIVLSAPLGTGIPNSNDIHKINSYLALKYGITLNTTGQPNYYDSKGNVIWNGNNNTGYQNSIFGIGRDDQSGLNQKQATSADTNAFTIFLGTLQNLNKNNTAEINNDRNFIILGSNNENGTSLYSPVGTYANNTTIDTSTEITRRYNRILKVNKTGDIGLVNLRLSNQFSYAPYVIVSNSINFEKSETRIYPVTNSVAQNITLNNGDYIGFLSPKLIPGGTVLETELWLRADFLSSNDNEEINNWYDISNYNRNVSKDGNKSVPIYLNNSNNYNPSLIFSDNALTGGSNFVNTNKEYYVYYVSERAGTGDQIVYSFITNGSNSNSFGWTGNNPWYYDSANRTFSGYTGSPFNINLAYVPNLSTVPSYIYANGLQQNIGNHTILSTNTGKIGIGNGDVDSNGYHSFTGKISEIIILSKDRPASNVITNDLDIQKVNSYLALKYGITLDPASHPNYYNTDGNIIWNGSNNNQYQKNLIAIGRDDATGFYQKQSKSANTDDIIMYLNNLESNNLENSSIIDTDKSYIILGSNDANTIINYTHPNSGNQIYQRYARTYKVANNNNITPQDLNLKISNQLYRSSYAIVSEDKDFDASNGSTRLYPVINGIVENITLKHNEYLSFIPEDFTPGGLTGLKREIWIAADRINPASLDSINPEISSNPFVLKWENRANNSNNFNFTTEDAIPPVLNRTSMNFRSGIEFNFLDTISTSPLKIISKSQNRLSKFISEQNFIPEANRSYYTITISRLDPTGTNYSDALNPTTSNFNKSIFTLNDSNNFGWYGNQNTTQLWLGSAASANYKTFANDNRVYGISINMLPNNSSLNRKLYFNGTSENFSSSELSTTSSKSIIGNNAASGSSNKFFGEILEILVLSKDGAGNYLTDEEIEKLNTHYALKYGISLKNSPKYTLSNGTTVYDASSTSNYANYTNDIFGLVRDDQSELYQKQALSEDNPILTIYLGELAETNNENTSNGLNDNEAIILGAKGDIGKPIDYSVPRATQFSNYTLQTDPLDRISSRFTYSYKAKVTTATGKITVNLAPNIGQWILLSKNENFLPFSDTRIRKIEHGVVNDIEIEDGDYIGFAFYMQAPGGVTTGLRMWLNASIESTITTNELKQVLTWTDYSGIGTTYRRRDANKESAEYVASDPRTNFHPTLLFDSSNDYLITERGPMSIASPDRVSFYSIVNHNFARDRSYFLGFGSQVPGGDVSRRPVFGVFRNANGGLARIRSSSATNSRNALFNPGATMIAGYHWKIRDSIKFEFDAYVEQRRHTSYSAAMNGIGMLGAGSLTDSYLSGTLPEVIAYEFSESDEQKNLTASDRYKINSYLGLKYGITLDLNKSSTAINYDYTFSNGTPVWLGNDTNAPYKNFHNNVASVIRDDDAALLNRQSHSTDVGDVVHMGVGTSLGINGILGEITENYSALTWGNNGKPFNEYSFGSDSSICGKMDSRIGGRVWLASPKNFNQDIILRYEKGQGYPYLGPNYQVYLLVADSPDKLVTANGTPVNNWDQIIPMTFVDGEHQVNYKFTEDTYFTFGGKFIGACESCNFKGEKLLQFTKTTWPTRGEKGPRTIYLNDNFNVKITVDDPGNNLRNRYPRYSSRKSLRERKRGGNTVTTTIKFLDDSEQNTAAVTSFNLLDIDRTGYTLSDVQVIGYCNGSPIYPNLYYTYRKPERSRYTIKNNSKAIAKTPGTRYSGNSGYTNARGMAFVEFENPVDEVKIIYNTPSSRNTYSTQEIGIGEMTFYCISPPPPPNEDGLIFTKQGTSQALLCETVDYAFRMINTNCDEKEVKLVDTLPLGMEWDLNSIIVLDPNFIIPENSSDDPNDPNYFDPDTELYDNATINIEQDGRQTLTITGLKVPGAAVSYSVRAKAVFAENATLTGPDNPYLNQASINYKRTVGDNTINVELLSTDRLTGNAKTSTIAIDSDRPKRLQTAFNLNKTCFGLGNEIEATLEIKNPNTDIDISGLMLDFAFPVDGGITYIPGSLIADGISLVTGSGENINDVDNYLDLSDLNGGNISIENFKIAKNATIKIKLKFKASTNLADYIFPNSTANNQIIDPDDITFSYDLYSESDIECMDSTTTFTNGEIDLSFCDFCTQQPIGGTPLKSDTGISTLRNTSNGWPTDVVPNGFLVLEAGKKGMVITRTSPSKITNPVSGMIIYNTDSSCLSIYVESTQSWKCIERSCNE